MKQRILNIIAVLFLMVGTATAQSVSIADFEARPGRNTSVEINVNGVSDMTALQFNLSLPAGFSIYEFDYRGGKTGDVMSLQPLKSGDYLVVIYNIYLKTFGEDLSLPISLKASTNGGTFSGSIYNIRMSTVDAVSYACESTSFTAIATQPVTGISLDKETATITEGETETLTATITPAYATDKTITWTTSDASVATVDGGVVTAVKAGTATITATAGGYSASCVVTVEVATGVENVNGENGEVKTIYDLQGRKVNTSSKGLYIINGKKVLVK